MANGYLEKVYDRWEKAGFSMGWLQGFKEKTSPNEFEQGGLILLDQQKLFNKAESTDSLPKLEDLEVELRRQQDSPIISSALSIVTEKIKVVRENQLKQSGKLETLYRNRIKEADTTKELDVIVSEFEDELSDKQVNRLKDLINIKKKEIRAEAHKDQLKADQKIKAERIKREKEEKEAQRAKKLQEIEERREESRRLQREADARKAAERELQREIEKEERRIAESIAREQARELERQ